jgi:prefoldin subunit 5
MGDETKERIADLASGWSVDEVRSSPGMSPTPDTAPQRKKPKTQPPPPPGSNEREALERAIVEGTPEPQRKLPEPSEASRSRPISVPPPVPVRAKPPSVPPPIPVPLRAKSPSAPPTRASSPSAPPTRAGSPSAPPIVREPPLIIESSASFPHPAGVPPPTNPHLAVPINEFDTAADRNRAGLSPLTIKRDAAEALLQIAAPLAREDPTAIDTSLSSGDTSAIERPSGRRLKRGGTLRPAAALRRQRGLFGDVRYVFTASLGIRRMRAELGELEARQEVRQTSRRRHLVALGRTAVLLEDVAHPALGDARERLGQVEDERSLHAGAVAAADAELERVRRDREAKAKKHSADCAAIDTELADLSKKLEPLEKEVASVRKRAGELREALRRLDKKLALTEALLSSVKGEKMDRAGIQADLATLKADRAAVQRDEPALAHELDALSPRVAAIEAARNEARRRRGEIEQAELDDQRRSIELLDAIGAKRKVVERATSDAEAARDRVLFELGERLYVDRSPALTSQLSPIDHVDLELGESDRRVMELREILGNIDRAKLARGAVIIFMALALIGGLTLLLALYAT